MFNYIQQVIADPITKSPSAHRYVMLLACWSLCLGFIVSTSALLLDKSASDTLVLGLASILAGLAGTGYWKAKTVESKALSGASSNDTSN
jgi:hypothetical protein